MKQPGHTGKQKGFLFQEGATRPEDTTPRHSMREAQSLRRIFTYNPIPQNYKSPQGACDQLAGRKAGTQIPQRALVKTDSNLLQLEVTDHRAVPQCITQVYNPEFDAYGDQLGHPCFGTND